MGLGISTSACGRCHACACVFVCIFMRIHMYVGTFFCSECYMYFTGVLGTSAWAGEYVTRVFFAPTYTSANTLPAGYAHMCICIYVCICMRMHMDAYVRL